MKRLLIVISLTLVSSVYAQKVFVNEYRELCIELYTAHDPMKTFVVALVSNDLLEHRDSVALMNWNSLDVSMKSKWTQIWAYHGYRIEPYDYPITTYLKMQPFIKEE